MRDIYYRSGLIPLLNFENGAFLLFMAFVILNSYIEHCLFHCHCWWQSVLFI